MHAIEVFADIWCPFAYVGLRAALSRREALARPPSVLVRAWPLERVNGAPEDPATTSSHVADLQAQCAPDLFAGFDPDRFPRTTVPALALAAAAYRHTAPVGERVSMALRHALWEEGRDVSDRSVLQAIADAHGVSGWDETDERSVDEDWHLGQARGVQGSPHFFCGEVSAFCPSLDISQSDGGHLDIRPDDAGLDAFLARCA